jgi:hydroxyacylglutathione hydrolase
MIKTVPVKIFPGEMFETNCYIIGDPETREGIIIDPGGEGERIAEIVGECALIIKYIINTHAHFDHIGANQFLKETFGAKILVHSLDAEMMKNPELNLSACTGKEVINLIADGLLEDGEKIKFGKTVLEVLHTPGHTPGSICFLTHNEIFTGDTLFAGSVGRTDLPGGSQCQLIRSIAKKLKPLPGSLAVYPGHGPVTTMDAEKKVNPYM